MLILFLTILNMTMDDHYIPFIPIPIKIISSTQTSHKEPLYGFIYTISSSWRVKKLFFFFFFSFSDAPTRDPIYFIAWALFPPLDIIIQHLTFPPGGWLGSKI